MKTINDFNFQNKKAIVRVDFNVPLDENFNITDDNRIVAAIPTIKKILADGGSVIIMSHFGRPKGEVNQKYSLKHIKDHVEKVLGVPVKFAEDCVGPVAKQAAADLKAGEVLLLENLRFHKEEEAGDRDFARELASLADIYVNDAFGTAHRAHASTAVIAEFMGENKCFGLLMAKEVESIRRVLENGQHPITAILGGAKVSSKLPIIMQMLDSVDNVIISGGMVYTFLKAKGGHIGKSLLEQDYMETASQIIEKAKEKGVNIYLSLDAVCAKEFNNDSPKRVFDAYNIGEDWMAMDIGELTIEKFTKIILDSKTILWNGPVGVFEMDNFAHGTIEIGKAIEKATKNGTFSLVGGGDSVAAVKKFGFEDKVSYVSTGGGAMLESLEGKVLPGVAAILN